MSSLPVSEVAGLQISKYTNIGSLAILIFDYCITFQDEVQWTWFRPWDLIRVIFTISRYLPFVGTGLTAYAVLGGLSPKSGPEDIIHIIGIFAAEALLIVRTWAFWQKSRRLLIGLLSYALLTLIAATAVNRSPRLLIPGGPSAPGYFEASRNGAVVFTFLAAFEIVVLILTAYKRFHDYGDFQQDSILTTVYRDGIIYILCVIAITVTNIIVCAAFPIAYSNMFDTLQLVIHSVLTSRMLFRLRSSNDQAYDMPTKFLVETNIVCLQPSNVWTTGAGSEV